MTIEKKEYYSLLGKTKKGLKWNLIGQILKYSFQTVFGVILARILSPTDYGLVGMVVAITGFSTVFIDSGLSSSIIQKTTITKIDLNSVFIFNVSIGFLVTLLIFISSGLISNFYNEIRLINIIKAISFLYAIQATALVQRAYLSKRLEFKKLVIADMAALLISGVLGIILAIKGLSYWALVIRTLSSQVISSIILVLISSWKPELKFDLNTFKVHWKYGSKILAANTIDQLARRFDDVVIGKLFSTTTLGYFSNAKHYAFQGVNLSSVIIKRTFFPLFSKLQNNNIQFKKLFLLIFGQVFFTIVPVFTFALLYADYIIQIVLGPKWIEMTIYFKLFCILGILYVLNQFLSFIINSKGEPSINLNFELFGSTTKIIIIISAIFLFNGIQPEFLIIIYILIMISGLVYRLKKVMNLIGVTLLELRKQIQGIIISLAIAISISVLFLYVLQTRRIGLFGSVLFPTSFLLIAKLLHVEAFEYILKKLRSYSLFRK